MQFDEEAGSGGSAAEASLRQQRSTCAALPKSR